MLIIVKMKLSLLIIVMLITKIAGKHAYTSHIKTNNH